MKSLPAVGQTACLPQAWDWCFLSPYNSLPPTRWAGAACKARRGGWCQQCEKLLCERVPWLWWVLPHALRLRPGTEWLCVGDPQQPQENEQDHSVCKNLFNKYTSSKYQNNYQQNTLCAVFTGGEHTPWQVVTFNPTPPTGLTTHLMVTRHSAGPATESTVIQPTGTINKSPFIKFWITFPPKPHQRWHLKGLISEFQWSFLPPLTEFTKMTNWELIQSQMFQTRQCGYKYTPPFFFLFSFFF